MSRISVDFPAPFGPSSPSRSPRITRSDRSRTMVLSPNALRDAGQFRDQPARALAGVQRQPHVAQALATRGALLPERFEPAHPSLVARPPGLDALADPYLFLGPELVEAPPGDVLGGQLVRLALLVGREIARVGAQQAAVEFDDPGRHAIEERSVVADDDGGRTLQQQLLEQQDAVDVEMVGRLVQQQQVGLQRHRERQRRTFAFPAGGIGWWRARDPARSDPGTRSGAPRAASARARRRSRRAGRAWKGFRAATPRPATTVPARRARCAGRRGAGFRHRPASPCPR